MRKPIRTAAALLLAIAMAASALTVSAFASSGKSDRANQSGKKVSSTVCGGFAAAAPDQAKEAALNDAGLDENAVKYVVCYVSWADHAPYAYEVKFSTQAAYYHYTIDLDSGVILDSSCRPHRQRAENGPCIFMNRGGHCG